MVDEIKGLKDIFFKALAAGVARNAEEGSADGRRGIGDLNLKSAKDLLGSLAGWAGKGKDEMVQIISSEIGNALANMLKEPLTQVLRDRKLQVTIELVPLNDKKPSGTGSRHAKPKSRRKSHASK